MKKETIILIGVAAIAGYYLYAQSKRRSGLVTVGPTEKITENEFNEGIARSTETPIEKITSIVKTIFPKKTAEQRAAKKLQRRTRRESKNRNVAGFSDNVLY